MKIVRMTVLSLLAGAAVCGATAAQAQEWRYDRYQADRAYQGAEVRAQQAWRDQRAARTAAYYGDYRAADAYARAAAYHRAQAHRDARYAQHENRAARHDYWHGGWGY